MNDTSRPITILYEGCDPCLNDDAVRACVSAVMQYCDVPPHQGLALLFTDDHTIRAYNARYLGHDYATDVISFPADTSCSSFPDAEEEHTIGDVIISLETCRRYAQEHAISPDQECARYITHAILHCLGYDDTTASTQQHMTARQEDILARCFAAQKIPVSLFVSASSTSTTQ